MKNILIATFYAISFNASASVDNLLTNSDFEFPRTSARVNYNYSGGESFLGWSVTGSQRNAVSILNTNYAEANLRFTAQSGESAIDLSGSGNTGPTSGISQTVSTAPGALYSLRFWVGNADGSGNPAFELPSTVNLSIDGVPTSSFTNADESYQSINWKYFEYTFKATATTTNISFLNGTALGDRYTGLDNVIMTTVPEPTSAAMLCLGLCGIFSLRRRDGIKK